MRIFVSLVVKNVKIYFIKDIKNHDKYSISVDYVHSFDAFYVKETNSKLLFDLSGEMIAHGFPYYSKKYQLNPDFIIQLLHPEPIEVLIKNHSFLYQTKIFTFKDSQFEVIAHIGTKSSIYKDGVQVGYLHRRDKMVLVCNNDLNVNLFSILSLNLYSEFGSESTIIPSPFNLWFQKKVFDKNWVPKV